MLVPCLSGIRMLSITSLRPSLRPGQGSRQATPTSLRRCTTWLSCTATPAASRRPSRCTRRCAGCRTGAARRCSTWQNRDFKLGRDSWHGIVCTAPAIHCDVMTCLVLGSKLTPLCCYVVCLEAAVLNCSIYSVSRYINLDCCAGAVLVLCWC